MQFWLTPETLIKMRETLEAHTQLLATHLYQLQVRLGAWLILGNGIGLLILSQALFSGRVELDGWVGAVSLRFIAGIGIAFLATVLTYFFNLFGTFVLAQLSGHTLTLANVATQFEKGYLNSELADELEKQALLAMTKSEKLQKLVPMVWHPGLAALTLIYLASGALFVWALLGGLHLTIIPSVSGD